MTKKKLQSELDKKYREGFRNALIGPNNESELGSNFYNHNTMDYNKFLSLKEISRIIKNVVHYRYGLMDHMEYKLARQIVEAEIAQALDSIQHISW